MTEDSALLPHSGPRDHHDQTTATAKNSRSHYPSALAPLVFGLLVLTMATMTMKDPQQVSDWASSFLNRYTGGTPGRHRRLFHPQNFDTYMTCTNILAASDGNYDNDLNTQDFTAFCNAMSKHLHGVEVTSSSLPSELHSIFVAFANDTNAQTGEAVIDIYGSRNGERDGINSVQGHALENLCNATTVVLDELVGAGQSRTGGGTEEGGLEAAGAMEGVKQEISVRYFKKRVSVYYNICEPNCFTNFLSLTESLLSPSMKRNITVPRFCLWMLPLLWNF